MTQAQPLYADLRQLRAWFRNTAPGGGRVTYAFGDWPDPEHPVIKQVTKWRQDGEVVTVQSRVNGKLYYLAERSRREEVRPAKINSDIADTVEGRIFAALDHAARNSLQCPSYTDLAEAYGLRDKQAAAHRFRKLVSQGLIRVQEIGGRRVVTIVETGASTASGGSA